MRLFMRFLDYVLHFFYGIQPPVVYNCLPYVVAKLTFWKIDNDPSLGNILWWCIEC